MYNNFVTYIDEGSDLSLNVFKVKEEEGFPYNFIILESYDDKYKEYYFGWDNGYYPNYRNWIKKGTDALRVEKY